MLRATGRLPGDEQRATADHELVLAERHAALRQAVTRLPPGLWCPCFRILEVSWGL